MITVISGGSESLKLIRAFRHFLDDDEIAVIANTSDSIWIDGTMASPDIDNLIYLFSGILDTSKWRGIKGDTFSTCSFFKRYFKDDIVPVGDKERAVHTARGRYFSEGLTATEVTKQMCRRFGICAKILPATDNRMELYCKAGDEFVPSINLRDNITGNELDIIREIKIEFSNNPVITREAASVISSSDAVIIGPGSHLTSLMPVIACDGMKDLLFKQFTIAFAPDLPKNPSGCALTNYNKILSAYTGFTDLMIQDQNQEKRIEGAMQMNTKMNSGHSAESLAWDLMSVIRSHRNQASKKLESPH